MRCWSIRQFLTLLVAAVPVLWGTARADTVVTDLALDDAIAEFTRAGLRVLYSSDLVRPGMRVSAAPASEEPLAALSEILEPHGLMLRRGFDDTWLIVRQPKTLVQSVAPVANKTVAPQQPTGVLATPMEEVVVSASRYEIQGSQSVSLRTISDFELELSPDIGDDAIRAVARLPGMASGGISALANVRGGEIGETLVRLDGLRLYDPFHLRDFQAVFSVIDPRVIHTMDIYTGGFPATYGDRMSGVIDVETMSAPEALHHEVGLSFFNSSFMTSGRLRDQRGEWVASARRSNLDLLYDRFSEQPDRPRYTDLFAKFSYELGSKQRITGNILRADDSISLADDVDREERASASQTDTYLWLRLDHNLSGRMQGSTLVARTVIDSARAGTSEKLGVSAGWLSDVRSFAMTRIESEWARAAGARSLFEFGGAWTHMSGRYDYSDTVDFDLLFDVAGAPDEVSRERSLAIRPDGHQVSLFSSLKTDINARLSTEIGLRWSEQSLLGSSHSTLSPRLGLRYSATDRTVLRASLGRFHQAQAISEIQVNDGVRQIHAPQRSDHLVLGVDQRIGEQTTLRVEAYSKRVSRIRPRFENLLNSRVLLPELKPDRLKVNPHSASARGLEVAFDGLTGAFDWWSSLTWSRVTDRIDATDILRNWDQTWALSAGFNLDLPRWSLGLGLGYRSGWPTTQVELQSGAPFPTARAAQRNTSRLNAFGTVDVRVNRKIRLEQSELTVFAEFANLTGRSNPCCVEYEIGDEEDAGQLILDERYYLPRIPSIGFNWAF